MRIQSITVGGFKNLSKSRLELERICAIVSPNNYGKSNLLEGIDFGIDFIHASRKERKNMMSWVRGIPLCPALENAEYIFEVEFVDDNLGEYRYVKYGFSFKWHRDDETGDCITDEWLETRENTSVRYTAYLKRKEGRYRKGKNTSAYRKIDLDSLQLALDVLGLIEDIEIADVIKSVQKVAFNVCSSLDLRDNYQPSPIEYAEDENELPEFDDADVPRALAKLRNNAPDSYDVFKDALMTLFPEFTAINLREFALSDEKIEQMTVTVAGKELSQDEIKKEIPFRLRERVYRLFVKSMYLNQPVSMASMSTGTKRAIWLLANVFIANYVKSGIVGIEEIETSIHPKMIRQLLEIVTEALEDTPLIISSHSPYLIQYLKPEKIYIGVPNNQGIAEFKKIQKNKLKYIVSNARDFGMSVGEYIFELLSGDSDSYEVLQKFLEG